MIVQAWADLPRVAVAAMAAEGYLPHATLIRGRGWTPATGQAGPRRAAAVGVAAAGPCGGVAAAEAAAVGVARAEAAAAAGARQETTPAGLGQPS